MLLSIIVITARQDPKLGSLVAALDRQGREGDLIEIVLVDFFGREPPRASWFLGPESRWSLGPIVYTKPKPTPFQGDHRVTSRNLHAIANARNTGFIVSSMPYLAFLDDRVTPGPRWLEVIREHANRGDDDRVICGPCNKKTYGSRVFDDRAVRSLNGRGDCPGDWLYGGNFAMPRLLYELVNGCEEGTDPFGRQDRVMGAMLRNNGVRIDFSTALGVTFDRDFGGIQTSEDGRKSMPLPHPFPRLRPGVPPADKGRAIAKRYEGRKRTDPATTPDLRALRARYVAGNGFPMHAFTADSRDWFDDTRFGDL